MSDVRLDDRGFTLGHGLFETVLWVDGRLDHWEAHVERLSRGCGVLGLPKPDPQACRDTVQAALEAAGAPERAAVRLNWSAGPGARGLDPPAEPKPQLTASAAALPGVGGPATLATTRVRRNEHSPASRLKTLSYLDNVLARAEVRAAGADEALMLNTAGDVACAAAANVFWVREAGVFTPALDCGVLDGIMRAQVISACQRLGAPVTEARATPDQAAGASMFLTNSLIGVRPVSRLDGQALPASQLTDAIAKAVAA